MEGAPEGEAPAAALAAVLKHSSALPPESAQVRGYDFNRGVDYRAVLEAFGTTGFQATNFGRAVHQINAMIEKKLEPLPQDEDQHEDLTQSRRPLTGCTIFLGYTSNLISSGIRGCLGYHGWGRGGGSHQVPGTHIPGRVQPQGEGATRERD
uniref:Deoxyhypusine synthase n=1 Tax=Pipistrellus kuhlii TaxID=59472 RepID=A0A7J7RIA7_PIPKU|nr:hypothetical protein mPipKuh1_010541 [Pipistrellus kuhlii]